MNQKQREFLVSKITGETDKKVKVLKDSLPKEPELSAYLYKAIMRGELKPLSGDDIIKNLERQAEEAADAKSFLSQKDRWGTKSGDNKGQVSINADDLFEMPDKFLSDTKEFKRETERIYAEIRDIKTATETLVTRIKLASNKTLDNLITEIDDMGQISLVDTKLKLLIGGEQ